MQLKRESAARAAAEEEAVRLRADQDVRTSEARSLEAQLAAMAAEWQKLGSTCSEAQQANRRLEAGLAANAARVAEAQVLVHPACPGCGPLCSAPLATSVHYCAGYGGGRCGCAGCGGAAGVTPKPTHAGQSRRHGRGIGCHSPAAW
jgi:hypothetical protein